MEDMRYAKSVINNVRIETEQMSYNSLPRILIVDDANFNVYSLKTILENFFNLESDFAYCAKDAI